MLSLLALLLSQGVFARVSIWSPVELQKQPILKNIRFQLSSFGRTPMGKTVIGRLVGANPINACHNISIPNEDIKMDESLVVMVKRGDCPFTQKVMNAQMIGASAVLIVDDRYEDVNRIIPFAETNRTLLNIPSGVIDKRGGDYLLNRLNQDIKNKNAEEIIVAVQFNLIK
jgi:hypothetical protein